MCECLLSVDVTDCDNSDPSRLGGGGLYRVAYCRPSRVGGGPEAGAWARRIWPRFLSCPRGSVAQLPANGGGLVNNLEVLVASIPPGTFQGKYNGFGLFFLLFLPDVQSRWRGCILFAVSPLAVKGKMV